MVHRISRAVELKNRDRKRPLTTQTKKHSNQESETWNTSLIWGFARKTHIHFPSHFPAMDYVEQICIPQ